MKKTYTEQEMQVICMGTDVIATSDTSSTGNGVGGGQSAGGGQNNPGF